MADSNIQLPADGVGKRLDTRTAPDGDHREVVVIGSPTTADVSELDAANGLDVDVTRVQGSVAVTNVGLTALAGAISGTEVQVDIVSGGGSGTQYTEDDAAPADPVGTALAMVRDDALSGQTTTDGDIVAARATDKGELYVKHVDAIPVTDNGGILTVDGTVIIGSSALPTGAATAALQLPNSHDVTVDNAAGASAVNIQDGGNSLTVDGTVAVTGVATAANQTTELASLAAIESDVDAVRVAAEILDNAISGSEMQVDVVAALPAGTNNIGDVDVLTLPALVAGSANIGDVDVASIAAGDNNIGNVDIVTLPALVAGSANIGDVDIASVAAGTVMEVVGDVAADAAVPANPVIIGARASTARPSDVSADGDSVNIWANRKGSPVVSMAPHVGLFGDPWTLTGETAQYTTTQTSAVLVAGGASERLVVTKVQIQAGGTTAGTLQLYFGTGAYSRGTNLAIFDGEFAPSATLKPGIFMDGPFISAANGDDLLVTTSAAINPLTITVWFYVVT